MSIEILSSEVVDQIAAGEVVERPAHLVKELLENSLDAGATKVEIDFDQGGRFVRLTDNGGGISQQDLPKALERFATSKISLSSDLWKLQTYGFRGEALASISAVSRLTMTSKIADANTAYRIRSEFGQREKVASISGQKGTTVLIEELFANVPARLKFLKSEAAESSQIKMVLKAMALTYPTVEFRVSQGGKLLHFWPVAKTKLERAKAVLEVEHLYEGTAQRNNVKAYSIFADPNTTAKTSRQMWIFAQNRWVQDRSMQAAINEAYRSLLMHGEYPIAATWVETDPSEVDVNIHPTKSQVKFSDAGAPFRAVQASIRETLEKAPWITQIVKTQVEPVTAVADTAPVENLKFSDDSFQATQFKQKTTPLFMQTLKTYAPPSAPQKSNEAKSYAPYVREFSQTKIEEKSEEQNKWSHLQILGQAGLTYIVAQSSEGILFIDQHAAHERVAFESLMQAWRGGRIDIQDFLFPLTIDLSEEKVEALLKKSEDLKKLGIELEALGPSTVGIKSAPPMLKEAILANEIEKLAHEIVENGDSFRMDKVIGDICATLACHSVIRAGQALSQEQMHSLLQEMDQFPLSSFCPHGRPVYVEYPFAKLEKDFGRTL